MLEFFVGLILGIVGGFVLGILFGRKNPVKVEAAVAAGKTEINKLEKK